MLRGLWKLAWLETKIFMREPLGAIGTTIFPVIGFLVLGRITGGRRASPGTAAAQMSPDVAEFVRIRLPVLFAIMIALAAVLSLVTIIAIYRENGILKRLRATPLRPWTILSAHVIVKLGLTAITLILMVLAGRRYYPADLQIPIGSFTLALLIATFSILSLGFLIASVVPTARFAQPLGAVLVYPMLALCGLFYPIEAMPPALAAVARVLPLTYVASLLTGILRGEPWSSHVGDVAALAVVFAACTALSSRVFRWE